MTVQKGLVASYLLDGEGGGRAFDWAAIDSWKPEDGLLWVHLDISDDYAVNWLEKNSGLDDVISAALLSDDPRPRCQQVKEGLLLMLRGVNLNPGEDPEDMVSIRLWMTEGKIISTRHRRLLSIVDMRKDIDDGVGPCNSGEFIVQLADKLVDRMSEVMISIDDRIDQVEDTVISNRSYQLRSAISTLRREAISLRRYLSPQRDALSKLSAEKVIWLNDYDRVRLREITDNTVRYIEDLDAMREKAIVIQEELMSVMSEQMDKRMYILSIVTAIFLPLGFLTGLLGVNIGGIPGAGYSWAFVLFCVFLLVIVVLQLFILRKLKWF